MVTREAIAAFQRDFSDLEVRVVDNLLRNIPSGLNRAIGSSRGDRSSASMDIPSHIQTMWRNVSVPMMRALEIISVACGKSNLALPHGLPNRSRCGLPSDRCGGRDYRLAASASEVDTVPLGRIPAALVDRIGGYDESLLTNEDYEFNTPSVRPTAVSGWIHPFVPSIMPGQL